MLILQSIILGLIQGLTEFIPISSSAHLVIVPWLFKWSNAALKSLSFDVALHIGTLVALLVFFAADWVRLIRAGVLSIVERNISKDNDRRMAWFLLLGCIPGGVAGVVFEDTITRLFHLERINSSSMIAMGIVLAGMGVLLFIAEHVFKHLRSDGEMTFRDAILVGLAQSLAIFPGVSRSGITISAGLALGLKRDTAARFSFLLSTPLIAGAGAKHVIEIIGAMNTGVFTQTDIVLFAAGFFAAAVSGFLCIKYLLRFLQKHSTDIFVYYRWGLAVLVIAVALIRG